MAVKSLENLFHEILKDVYYLEKRLLRTLTKMASGANSMELAAIFEKRRDQTERQVQRLEKVFAILGKRPEARPWPMVDGIIDEGPELLEHYKSSPALDAGLLASAQAVAHYEITRYATLKRWAAMLGMQDAARLLDETLLEETQTNQDLTVLADRMANAKTTVTTLSFEAAPHAALLPEVA
jgi:ferritin-like metal-binding protein YciE